MVSYLPTDLVAATIFCDLVRCQNLLGGTIVLSPELNSSSLAAKG